MLYSLTIPLVYLLRVAKAEDILRKIAFPTQSLKKKVQEIVWK